MKVGGNEKKVGLFGFLKNRFNAKRSLLERRTGVGKIVFVIFFVLFLLYALTLLYPLFWMVLNSFRNSTDYQLAIAMKAPFSLKIVFEPKNYATVVKLIATTDATYFQMVWNSVWTSILSSFLSIVFPTLTAYCLAKYEFRLRGVLYAIAIIVMILPIVGTGGAALRFWASIGVYNTPLFIVLNHLGGLGGMLFLIMYGFFQNIHWAYAEAVFIDGGNDYTALFRVMLPQASNMLLLFFVMNFMGNWNDYTTFLIYMPSYPTLAMGMYLVSNTLERTGQMPIYYAALVLSMIPILALFIAFSNQILTRVSIGGIKG